MNTDKNNKTDVFFGSYLWLSVFICG